MSVRRPMLLLLLSAVLLMETSAWNEEFLNKALEALGEGKRHAGDHDDDASADVARSGEAIHGSSPLQQVCRELQATRTISDQNIFRQLDENKDGKLDKKELGKILHDCAKMAKNGV